MGQNANASQWLDRTALHRSDCAIRKLFDSGIFSGENVGDPLFEAAVIQLLICLNDMLQKARVEGVRVSFKDDVDAVLGSSADVTTLINDARNAACHMSSKNHDVAASKLSFCVVAGNVPVGIRINGHTLACAYPDDIAIGYGPIRVYLRRHALRAYTEAREALGL